MIDLDLEELDRILLLSLCALGDPDAIAERGRAGRTDRTKAIELLKGVRQGLRGPERPATDKKYQMLLESVGNPDFGQYAPVSNPTWVSGDTLLEMRMHAENYRSHWDLGGGNWVHPVVLEGDRVVGHFSYNLRFWEGRFDPKDWESRKEILIEEGT